MKAPSRRPSLPARRALTGLGGATIAIAALLAILLLPARCADRRNAVAFDGVVERKEIPSLESRYGTRLSYILVIREETGKLVRFEVPRAIYERALVGMRVQKKAGESWPTLGAKTGPN